MLLQLSNYLAIKAAQKPRYGLSRGPGRPGQIPFMLQSKNQPFFSAQTTQTPHYAELSHNKKKVVWMTFEVFLAFGKPGMLQCMFRICFPIVGDLSLRLFSREGVADMLKNAQRCITRTCVIPYTLIILAMTSETSSHFSMLWTERGGSQLKQRSPQKVCESAVL